MQSHPHKDFLLSSLTFKSENLEKSSEFRDNIAFLLPAQLASYRIYIRRRTRVACLRRFLDVWQRAKNKFFDTLEACAGVPAQAFSIFYIKWRPQG